MNTFSKTILSIPSLIGLVYLLTFIYPKSVAWISNNIIDFEYQGPLVNVLTIVQIGYLIYRLWNFKNVKKSTKNNWTFSLILFNIIASLIYIWRKDEELLIKNKGHSA